ncbi:hypothetical protein [Clostridium butyricum]|uniref:hypothetical protein n=1 Tax=Clostridium butyricum TaxID=1492 RepID=UPI00374E50D7
MKKHVLCSVSEEKKRIKKPVTYYDMLTQVSYIDKDCNIRIDKLVSERSSETRVIENSDDDYFELIARTSRTFSIENDDNDEFNISRTYITEKVEESDADEFDLYENNQVNCIDSLN